MPLAFVTGRLEANALGRPDDLQKEWQACRDTIGKLDTILVDLRKYGFGLASTLLTANGVLGGIANLIPKTNTGFVVPSSVIAALVAVTMVLVVVLFVVDRYYAILQWGAVNRARTLENALSLDMTNEIARWVGFVSPRGPRPVQVLWRWVALLQYGSFVLVALGLGIATMRGDAWPPWQSVQGFVMWAVCAASLTVIGVVYWIAAEEWISLAKAPPASVHMTTIAMPAANLPAKSKTEVQLNQLPANSRVVAVVVPTDNTDLAMVGCRVDGTTLRIMLSNPTDEDVPIAKGSCQVFLYS